MLCAHQVGFSLRKLAFALVGKAVEQCFADDEAQHRIPEKLEALVIALVPAKRLGAPRSRSGVSERGVEGLRSRNW